MLQGRKIIDCAGIHRSYQRKLVKSIVVSVATNQNSSPRRRQKRRQLGCVTVRLDEKFLHLKKEESLFV
ncbi:unnamed protein product, partial [Hymenolepis diminuta]